MDFFDKLGKTASEAYKVTADKTSKMAKEAKMKIRISDLKSKIEDKYEEIGEKVYNEYVNGKKTVNIPKDLEEECKFIKEANDEIDDLLQQCLDINDKKICVKCSAKIEKDVKFCPECGEKQPKQKECNNDDKKEEKSDEENKSETKADAQVEVIEEVTVETTLPKTSLEKTTEVEANVKIDDKDNKDGKKEVTKKVTKVNTKKEKKDDK